MDASDILYISNSRCSIDLHLISWMHGPQNLGLHFGGNMYIDPRRLDGTVSQNLLYTTDINPLFDQICCKRMPLRYNKDKRKNPVFSRVSAFVVAYSIPFPTLIASEKSVE